MRSAGRGLQRHFVTYFDIALTELWREAIGPYGEMTATGTDMVVAEVRARYHTPARLDEVLDIAVAPTRIGNTALSTRIEVRRHGELAVEGDMRHVFVDAVTRAKRPIPDDVRRALEPYLASTAVDGTEQPADPVAGSGTRAR